MRLETTKTESERALPQGESTALRSQPFHHSIHSTQWQSPPLPEVLFFSCINLCTLSCIQSVSHAFMHSCIHFLLPALLHACIHSCIHPFRFLSSFLSLFFFFSHHFVLSLWWLVFILLDAATATAIAASIPFPSPYLFIFRFFINPDFISSPLLPLLHLLTTLTVC